MKARMIFLIESPEDIYPKAIADTLRKIGCRVESLGVLLPIRGMQVSKDFLFEAEKPPQAAERD